MKLAVNISYLKYNYVIFGLKSTIKGQWFLRRRPYALILLMSDK